MGLTVHILGMLVTLACAVLLLRHYGRARAALLLWSGLCFVGFTIANAVLLANVVLAPGADWFNLRLGITAVSLGLLIYGLVWESN